MRKSHPPRGGCESVAHEIERFRSFRWQQKHPPGNARSNHALHHARPSFCGQNGEDILRLLDAFQALSKIRQANRSVHRFARRRRDSQEREAERTHKKTLTEGKRDVDDRRRECGRFYPRRCDVG